MITSISVIAICVAFMGLSYAYWYIRNIQDTTSNATTGCFQVELINQSGEINLENAYPITDEEGLKLKPFSFTIHNTCSIFAHYYVNVELLEGTTLNSHYVATRVNNEEIKTLDSFKTAVTTITNSVSSYTVAEGYLGADDQEDYSISLWIDEDVTVDDDIFGKIFKSKVVVNSEPGSYDPVSAGYTKLGDAILANEYQTTPEIAKSKIAAKQKVDLTNTAPVIKWVEKTGNMATKNIVKISSSAIKTDNQTSNLTENDTKLKIYTSYTFNSDTARYILTDMIYADPTTLDYSGSTKYYFMNENINYNQANDELYTWNNNNDTTAYQITGATKKSTSTKWNNVSYESITYTLTGTTMTEMELETDKSDKGLYQAPDDYGDSYYYRGNVKNNNVYFAGMYWQIVRVNGDGTIRLIYNGTTKNATGNNQMIDAHTYQFNNKYNDPAFIGYMYGDPDATTFAEVHANINNSTVKDAVDAWYKNSIEDEGYSSYLSNDTGFCGDRSLYSNSGGDGITTSSDTRFAPYGRYSNKTAEFTCPEPERDLYTTSDAKVGNKALTYPVGLITYDEMALAGMDQEHVNKLSWIYSSQHFWTMSPAYFRASDGNNREWNISSSGYLGASWTSNSFGIRPVINLKADVEISGGTGTSNDPFVIKTE